MGQKRPFADHSKTHGKRVSDSSICQTESYSPLDIKCNVKQNKSVICFVAVILLIFTHGGLHLSGVAMREEERESEGERGQGTKTMMLE